MTTVEQVLVVDRTVFDRAGSFQGLNFRIGPYLEAFFSPGTLQFIPRPNAEVDPAFKQIIPYVLMVHEDRFFSYVRGARAAEKRLLGHRSIGVGGHINPADDLPLFAADFRDAYRGAVEREVAEEVVVDAAHTDRVVALLNDDSTEVGRVHLGIVHLWSLDRPEVRKREQMITQFGFLTVPQLQGLSDTLETWSKFCVDAADGLLSAAQRPIGRFGPD